MLKKYWKHTLISFCIFLLTGAGYYIGSMYYSLDSLQKPPEASRFTSVVHQVPDKIDIEPPKWLGEERVNILLLGGDSRGLEANEIPRSDSILLASFDPKMKRANLFSLLRDTYVDIPGFGKDRLNVALAYGGPELAMKTASNLTGLDIQYYVYTDFVGFIRLIDALGGVEFEIEKDMKYTSKADKHKYDIDLKKGKQLLNGETALMYARFRHDAMSDYARTQRQRDLLRAVANKLKSAWSLLQFPSLIKEVSPYVETNLSADDIVKLAAFGYDSTIEKSHQIPPMDNVVDTRINNASVLRIIDENKLKRYIQEALEVTAPVSETNSQ